jgi:hypothetical protein
MKQEAIKHILRHQPDDTFYMVDLANVQRMFKVTVSPFGDLGPAGPFNWDGRGLGVT